MLPNGSSIHLAKALFATAVFVGSSFVQADDHSHVPTTSHDLEHVQPIPDPDESRASGRSAGKPILTHEGGTSPAVLTKDNHLILSGDQEVPAVATAARGKASVTIGADKTVMGGVTTTAMEATAAHIHTGAVGKNGPVVITLSKDGQHGWLVPADCVLTDAQYTSFKAGELYINVHSAAHEAGEIRAQIMP